MELNPINQNQKSLPNANTLGNTLGNTQGTKRRGSGNENQNENQNENEYLLARANPNSNFELQKNSVFTNNLRNLITKKNIYDKIPLMKERMAINSKLGVGLNPTQLDLEQELIDDSLLFLKQNCPKEESVLAFYSLAQELPIDPKWTLDTHFWYCLQKIYDYYTTYPSIKGFQILLESTTKALKDIGFDINNESRGFLLADGISNFIWEMNRIKNIDLLEERKRTDLNNRRLGIESNLEDEPLPFLPIAEWFIPLFNLLPLTKEFNKNPSNLQPKDYISIVANKAITFDSYKDWANKNNLLMEQVENTLLNWNTIGLLLGVSDKSYKTFLSSLLLSIDPPTEKLIDLSFWCKEDNNMISELLYKKLLNTREKITQDEMMQLLSPYIDIYREEYGRKRKNLPNTIADAEILKQMILRLTEMTNLEKYAVYFPEINEYLESEYKFQNNIKNQNVNFIIPTREYFFINEDDANDREEFLSDSSNIKKFPWFNYLYPSDTILGYLSQIIILTSFIEQDSGNNTFRTLLENSFDCYLMRSFSNIKDSVIGSTKTAEKLGMSQQDIKKLQEFIFDWLIKQLEYIKVPTDPDWLFYLLSFNQLQIPSLTQVNECQLDFDECFDENKTSYLIYQLLANKTKNSANTSSVSNMYEALSKAYLSIQNGNISDFLFYQNLITNDKPLRSLLPIPSTIELPK